MSELGHCRYCGEVIMLDYPEGSTMEEKIQRATKFCKCAEAKHEADKELELERAKARIEQLFGNRSNEIGLAPIINEEIHCLMNTVVELIANNVIKATTIEINGITKAKINISAKGKINIERAQAIKYKLEA